MKLFEKLFGRNGAAMPNLSGMPALAQTKATKALRNITDPERLKQHQATHGRKTPLMHTDHKALERNKYAPWGRGVHSGLPI